MIKIKKDATNYSQLFLYQLLSVVSFHFSCIIFEIPYINCRAMHKLKLLIIIKYNSCVITPRMFNFRQCWQKPWLPSAKQLFSTFQPHQLSANGVVCFPPLVMYSCIAFSVIAVIIFSLGSCCTAIPFKCDHLLYVVWIFVSSYELFFFF